MNSLTNKSLITALQDIAKNMSSRVDPWLDKFLTGLSMTKQQFAKIAAERLAQPSFDAGLDADQLAHVAMMINDMQVINAVAKRISPAKRKEHFPTIAHKFEAAPAMGYGAGHPGGAPASSGTTTADVAYYPVPLAGKRKKKKKKKNAKS